MRSGAFFKEPRRAEVYNIGGGAPRQLFHARSDQDVRGTNRAFDELVLCRRQPRRRSHLVDWRRAPLSVALSGMAFHLRHSRDAGGDPRRDAAADASGRGGRLMVSIPSGHDWVAAGIPGLLSVVIPARNEAENLQVVVPTLLTALEGAGINHEILVVNDGSTDDTRDVLVRAGGAPR